MGPFLWGSHANGQLRIECDEEDVFVVAGTHDGYRRLVDPVSHERRLSWRRSLGFRIDDVLAGDRPHDFELFWNLGPEIEVAPLVPSGFMAPFSCGFGLARGGQPLGTLLITSDRAARGAHHRGDADLPAGFESPRYRVLRPIVQIAVSTRDASCRFTTFVLEAGVGLEAAATERWA
jgi:hypothetical protein